MFLGPLRIAADLMHLLYIADEYTDVESAVGTQEISAIVLDALHNPDKPRPAGESIIGEMIREYRLGGRVLLSTDSLTTMAATATTSSLFFFIVICCDGGNMWF